jgi:hypothetical protein
MTVALHRWDLDRLFLIAGRCRASGRDQRADAPA